VTGVAPDLSRHSARRRRSGLRSRRLAQAVALVVGLALAAFALKTALYIFLLTAVVALCVWPLLIRKRTRVSYGMTRRVVLLAAITMGFWIVTTTAVRFADSSGTEDGAGATSLVSVSPWGQDEDPSALLTSGFISALSISAIVLAARGFGRRSV
jgi:hypothetical protein